MDVGDQFRRHPAPVCGLLADDSLGHSRRDQSRVLCCSPVRRYAFRSYPRQVGQSRCRHIHHAAGGPNSRNHYRPPVWLAPCDRCSRRATRSLCLGRCLAPASLHTPAHVSGVRL